MPRRTAAEAARTREAIVGAAHRRFVDEGFNGTTTAAVAKDAGLSQSALFHHFPDKKALFLTVLERELAEYDAAVRIAALGERTPLGMMLAGCRRSLELASEPAYRRIVATDARVVLDDVELRRIDASLGRATTRLGLELLVGTGDLDPATDIDALTTVIYGSLTEAAFELGRGGGSVEPGRIIAMIERILLAHAPPGSVRPRRR